MSDVEIIHPGVPKKYKSKELGPHGNLTAAQVFGALPLDTEEAFDIYLRHLVAMPCSSVDTRQLRDCLVGILCEWGKESGFEGFYEKFRNPNILKSGPDLGTLHELGNVRMSEGVLVRRPESDVSEPDALVGVEHIRTMHGMVEIIPAETKEQQEERKTQEAMSVADAEQNLKDAREAERVRAEAEEEAEKAKEKAEREAEKEAKKAKKEAERAARKK